MYEAVYVVVLALSPVLIRQVLHFTTHITTLILLLHLLILLLLLLRSYYYLLIKVRFSPTVALLTRSCAF